MIFGEDCPFYHDGASYLLTLFVIVGIAYVVSDVDGVYAYVIVVVDSVVVGEGVLQWLLLPHPLFRVGEEHVFFGALQ